MNKEYTVSELIEELKRFPQDLKVVCAGELLDIIEFREDYCLGDCANPNCRYENVVYLE